MSRRERADRDLQCDRLGQTVRPRRLTPTPYANVHRIAAVSGNRAFTGLIQRTGLPAQGAGPLDPGIEASIRQAQGGGRPLDRPVRTEMESHFGVDLSPVRIHADGAADTLNRAVQAEAFTTGTDVFIRPDRYAPRSTEGRELIAHELTHVVQQTSGSPSGPARVSDPADSAEVEARAVASSLRNAPAPAGPEGDQALLPAIGQPAAPHVQRYDTPEHTQFGEEGVSVTVAGHTMTQGEMIAMGDFFTGPAQMEAHPEQVGDVLAAIRSGRAGTADWIRATGGRYTELALQNEAHFAAPNPTLVPVVPGDPAGGQSGTNHLEKFQEGHNQALWASAIGNHGPAQALNSFAGHFLTDAFSAGHVVNKLDVMLQFELNLHDRGAFLDAVAARAWQDADVQRRMSIREPADMPLAGDMGTWNFNFDSEGMFQRFLRGVDEKRPEVVGNSVAKAVHDALNELAADPAVGGLEVENFMGDKWRLSGDETLAHSPESLEVARKAVAQSNANLAEVADRGSPIMTAQLQETMFNRVWAYVPHPTADGTKQVTDIVDRLTDPANAEMVETLGDMLAGNIDTIISGAEDMGAIRVEGASLIDEIGYEASRALDWREWMRLAY